MKSILLALFSFFLLCFTFSCDNQYRSVGSAASTESQSSDTSSLVGLSKDAYQVTEEEYDNYFVSRYGLLHQKFSDTPFTGRIVTITAAGSGNYVSSDESWKQGKKEGVSTRWFSNGSKMYERNYSDGKWNGTVTRWWPNGQKMYVRAYSNGLKHGREATWRSDGTPIDLSAVKSQSVPSEKTPDEPSTENSSDSLPTIAFPQSNEPTSPEPLTPPSADSIVDVPALAPESEPSLPDLSAFPADPVPDPAPVVADPPVFEPLETAPEFEPIATDAPPVFEPLESPVPMDPVPALPGSDESLPPLPGSDANEATDLPGLPDLDAETAMPPLPGLPEADGVEATGLPPLPESSDGSNELPPLPGLPEGTETQADGLPPLPDFPE